MCGRAFSPRFLFSWPNSRMGVMGGTQAAGVLAQIAEDSHKRLGKPWSEKEAEQIKRPIIEQIEREGSPYFTSARLWDDGIIDPIDTRKVLALSLRIAMNSPSAETKFGIFRM